MKYILLCIFIPSSLFSQEKPNEIYYSNGIITQEIIQNYLSNDEKVIQNKVVGKNARVEIDTVFKKYTVEYSDDGNKDMAMIFRYVRDYYPDQKGNYSGSQYKMYLMEFQGYNFFLIDFLSHFSLKQLVISSEERLPNNCTLLYRIKNAELKR